MIRRNNVISRESLKNKQKNNKVLRILKKSIIIHMRISKSKSCQQIFKSPLQFFLDALTIYRVIFFTGTPPKSTEKLILARLGVSWPMYVNVDSPNLGFGIKSHCWLSALRIAPNQLTLKVKLLCHHI